MIVFRFHKIICIFAPVRRSRRPLSLIGRWQSVLIETRLDMKKESMNITYKDIHEFRKEDLEDLFLSVEWSSGHFPDKLVVAMRNFSMVYSAWDGNKLVGMVCAMDDGIMTAYLHYMLVRPEYHQQGIGHRLLEMMKKHYESYLRIALIAYNQELGFYESCGFKRAEDASPMFITSLWT